MNNTDEKRCCDQEFLIDMINLCTESRIADKVFCDNCAALYFAAVSSFGNSAFQGKSLPVWLIEDGAKNPQELAKLRTTLRALSIGMGKDAQQALVTVILEPEGRVSARVEEVRPQIAGAQDVVSPSIANRAARQNATLLYGPHVDLSGISQKAEQGIRARLGADSITILPRD